MAPPAPLGGRLGRLKLAPSPRILSSAALKSSPEGPQLLLPLPPRSWGISFGSGGPPVSPCRHTQLIQPAGRSRSRGRIGVPVRARSPVLAFRTALTKRHAGAPRTEACSLAVRRPEAPNPGVGRAVLPLVARREGPSFSSSRWVPRHPWAVAASFPSLLPWSHVLLPWVSPLPTETPVTGAGPTPAHYDLIFINCLCKDPISK